MEPSNGTRVENRALTQIRMEKVHKKRWSVKTSVIKTEKRSSEVVKQKKDDS